MSKMKIIQELMEDFSFKVKEGVEEHFIGLSQQLNMTTSMDGAEAMVNAAKKEIEINELLDELAIKERLENRLKYPEEDDYEKAKRQEKEREILKKYELDSDTSSNEFSDNFNKGLDAEPVVFYKPDHFKKVTKNVDGDYIGNHKDCTVVKCSVGMPGSSDTYWYCKEHKIELSETNLILGKSEGTSEKNSDGTYGVGFEQYEFKSPPEITGDINSKTAKQTLQEEAGGIIQSYIRCENQSYIMDYRTVEWYSKDGLYSIRLEAPRWAHLPSFEIVRIGYLSYTGIIEARLCEHKTGLVRTINLEAVNIYKA